ncbi:hypothetical protein FRC10_007421, partial [Ceratobasidium sp. 414]
MEILDQWLAGKPLHLEGAVSRFFDTCIKLRSILAPKLSHHTPTKPLSKIYYTKSSL